MRVVLILTALISIGVLSTKADSHGLQTDPEPEPAVDQLTTHGEDYHYVMPRGGYGGYGYGGYGYGGHGYGMDGYGYGPYGGYGGPYAAIRECPAHCRGCTSSNGRRCGNCPTCRQSPCHFCMPVCVGRIG